VNLVGSKKLQVPSFKKVYLINAKANAQLKNVTASNADTHTIGDSLYILRSLRMKRF